MGLNGEAIAKVQHYRQAAASLLLYQSVLSAEVGQTFVNLLEILAGTQLASNSSDAAIATHPDKRTRKLACLRAYGQWFTALANQRQSWQHHLITQILRADNAFSRQVSAPKFSRPLINSAPTQPIPDSSAAPKTSCATTGISLTENELANRLTPGLLQAVHHDLAILHSLYHLPVTQLSEWVHQVCGEPALPVMQPLSESKLPVTFPYEPEWTDAPRSLATYYRNHGVGIFGQYIAFRWQPTAANHATNSFPTGQLIGVEHSDPIQLRELIGYEHPKQQLIQNTEFLLRGYRAQNVLLYGSRGAGKSSLVKALLTAYHAQGLRLVEVPKAHLSSLPQIVEPLRQTTQKFIIFVDDLSFEDDDEAFKALKVVLEGGITARPQNVVVYATSNRRHLIREFHSERPRPKDAEEIQAWDTVQEKLSFSDRFGLTLTFTPADQPTYLNIVHALTEQAGLTIDIEELDWRARQWATRHNGRSGRTARQFVDFLIAESATTQP